jgi:hypothetical protein
MFSSKKFEKPQKSKMRKHETGKESFKDARKKHRDKSTYRLMKEEEKNAF